MTTLSPTPRSTVRRLKERARTDRADLYDVLDSALVCHLGLVLGGSPVVLPTGYGRSGDTLYLHGSTGARSLREAVLGQDVSICVTLLDGIVYARAAMHFSMNYRSAVIHGRCREVTGDEKWDALHVIVEHLAPGSWDHARVPNKKELAATAVLAIDLAEASVKVRAGEPKDDEQDVLDGRAWAGVVPLHQSWGTPIPAADLAPGAMVPPHVTMRMR